MLPTEVCCGKFQRLNKCLRQSINSCNVKLLSSPCLTLLARQQVPKRIYTLEELRLNKIEAEKFLSPADETLNTVRTVLQVLKRSPNKYAASPCD